MVKYWLGKGLKVDEPDAGGYTALHLAAYRGEADRVTQLLSLGANPNAPAKSGWTPLKSAEAEGHAEVVKLLRAAGAK
jgi:ankyrin repeat protein